MDNKRHVILLIRILLILANFIGLFQFFQLSSDIVYGNHRGDFMLIKPSYGFMRVPESDQCKQTQSCNKLAADFAPVYFSGAMNTSLEEAYDTEHTADPWKRASRSSPALHYFYSKTLAKISYGWASFIHLFGQIILFYLSIICTFKILGLKRGKIEVLLFIPIVLFATPSGLAWFERGQFSLFVASAYLWSINGIVTRKNLYFFIAALFAFFKWTSLVFISMTFLFFLLHRLFDFKKNKWLLGQTVLNYAVFSFVFLLLFFLFYEESLLFLEIAFTQEHFFVPTSMSILNVLPEKFFKYLFVLLLCGIPVVIFFKVKSVEKWGAPVLVSFCLYSSIHPTLSFDYSIPYLLGLIPYFMYFVKNQSEQKVSFGGAYYFLVAFLLSILFLGYSTELEKIMPQKLLSFLANYRMTFLLANYLFFIVVFLLFSLILLVYSGETAVFLRKRSRYSS